MDESLVTIRRAKESDMMFYFVLRNEEGVRKASFSGEEEIGLETHTSWFLNKIKNPNCYMFVAVEDDKTIGQIRIDIESGTGETNISIAPEGRGKGYAPIIIREASVIVFKNVPEIELLVAHIKPDNVASIKSFERAGFLEKDMIIYKSVRCKELILRRSDYGL